MKYWVVLLLVTLFSNSAEAASSSQDFIAKKRYEASQAKKISEIKVTYLRNNKDKTNIINTNAHYSIENLYPANDSKTLNETEQLAANTADNKKLASEMSSTAYDAGSLTKVEIQEAPNGL
jgi:hypothetical protein